MKTNLVVSSHNLQTRSPISFTLILYLAFDKWNVPEWIYGAVGFLLLMWFIAWIVSIVKSETVDIFKGWDEMKFGGEIKKSKFQQKLHDLRNKKET